MNQLDAMIHIDRACGLIDEYDYFVDPSVLSRIRHFDFIAVPCDALFFPIHACDRETGGMKWALTTDN